MRRNLTPAMLVFIGIGLTGVAQADVLLVENGQPKATIVIAKDAVGQPTLPTNLYKTVEAPSKIAAAAQDVQTYIEKISGAKLPIIGDDQPMPKGPLVLIGRSLQTKALDAQIPNGETPTRDEEGYFIMANNSDLLLAGNDNPNYHGTEYAADAFLNSLGVRWYMPGDFGEFVPKRATISIETEKITSKPDFKMRNWWGPTVKGLEGEVYRWKIRNGMNPILDFVTLPRDGSIRNVLPPAREVNNPFFADVLGKDAQGQPSATMPNLSSDKSVEFAVNVICDFFRKNPTVTSYGISPDDGTPVDYSPETQKANLGMTDIGGTHGTEAPVTDEWMNWVQEVAQGVYKQFPDHFITTNGYANRNTPPIGLKPDPKVWIMFAGIWSDTMHAYDNPLSWQTERQGKMIQQWCKDYNNVYMYNYIYYMLAGCGAPIPLSHKTAHDMPLYKKWGVVGFSDEGRTVRTETGIFPTYLRARMMWNAGLDVNKERNEFFANWYGPAAKPAMAFWEDLENTFETTPWLAHEDRVLPFVYSPELMTRLEKDVSAAEALATNDWNKPRVHADRVTLENLKAYLAMNSAEWNANFSEAATQARRMIDVRKEAGDLSPFYYNPDPKHNGDSPSFYYWPSWKREIYYKKVAAAIDGTTGTLIKVLPEQAKCKLDPRDDGRYDEWYKPDQKDADWTTVLTTKPFYRQVAGGCDSTGYPYLGALWYRQEFDVPNSAKGKNVYLYCAAIEPEAWVWVNGKFVGHREFHECYERPNALDMDVTNALIPGKKNTIAIRVFTSYSAAALADALSSRLFLYSPKSTPISLQK